MGNVRHDGDDNTAVAVDRYPDGYYFTDDLTDEAITMIKAQAVPSPYVLLWQFVATILLYPFSQRLIDRFEDADVRFR